MDTAFKGAAKRLDDLDLTRLSALFGFGEDEIHAFLDVEASATASRRSVRSACLFLQSLGRVADESESRMSSCIVALRMRTTLLFPTYLGLAIGTR